MACRGPTVGALVAVLALSHAQMSGAAAGTEGQAMMASSTLEELLATGNWAAVDEAARQGAAVLPLVRRFVADPNYRVRQVAVSAAGRLGADEAGDLLGAALSDTNVNVRLAAAAALAARPYPAATEAVLDRLQHSAEPVLRETLALAAGHLPGARTIAVLEPLSGTPGQLGTNARLALARLGHRGARSLLLADLASPQARVRYETAQGLRYVGDPALASHLRPLLTDRANAAHTGPVQAPRYRRVCDAALDTVVALLGLSVPFPVGPPAIYSDDQLQHVRGLLP